MGIDLAAGGMRQVTSFGEPGVAVQATRAMIEHRFGVDILECVDPETGVSLPEGDMGEVGFTNLIGDTQPLLRYRSRDAGRLVV